MSFPKHTRENSAQPGIHTMSLDDAITFAIEDGAVDSHGRHIPIKQVADLMAMPRSVVYDIASQRRKARVNELPLIVRATNVILPVDVIEHQLGRVGIRLPVVSGVSDPSSAKAAAACREFGELMEKYGTAGGDFRYTRDEVAEVRVQAEELCRAAMELVAQLEAQAVGPKAVAR